MLHPRKWLSYFEHRRHVRKILAILNVARTEDSTGAYRWLWDGLESVLRDKFSPEEHGWIDRIESLRDKMNASDEELIVEDFGAASPSLTLGTEEMEKGRTVKRTVKELSQKASKSSFWAMILHKIIRGANASSCLEMGTCIGVSAAYQGAALELQHQGRLVTLEGAPSFAARAQKNLKTLGLENVKIIVGKFQDTLESAFAECGPLDYAFIDGHHEELATLQYFEQLLPRMKKQAILVFDDIDWSDGMKRAWKKIENDPRIDLAVNLGQIGVVGVGRKTEGKKLVNLEMPW